jgi:DNA end-binding protein Ku
VPDTEIREETRARSFWSGTLSFGLVSIPVDLLPAQRSAEGALHLLDADGTPLVRRYFCPAEEKELSPDDLVHGYELGKGKVVVVTDEELEALAPKKSREIDLRRFVDRDSIDPLYFERSYFLVPGADSSKAYRLLCAVMERSRRAGIATFVMREKEYLIAIFAESGLLRAETLRFADEVRSSADVGLAKRVSPDPRTLDKVRRAVASLEQKKLRVGELGDPHEPLRKLAQQKFRSKRGVVRATESRAESGGEVIDLMEVLRRSLAESGLTKKGGKPGGARRKRAAHG